MRAHERCLCVFLSAVAALAATAPAGWAGATGGEGEALLRRARELGRTSRRWRDRRQVLTLHIIDERGNERRRKLLMLTRRPSPGKEQTLAVFLEPADVRGSAFLQHVPRTGPSAQWLYLPELGRTRRISGAARRQSFMGTDFSYADLDLIENALHWGDDQATTRRVDSAEGQDGRVWFERTPHDPAAAYERVRLQLSAADAVLRAMEMYDDGETAKKVLTFEEIRDVGGIPTAFRLEMVRPARGTRTLVDVSDVHYDQGIPAESFTRRALERGLEHLD